VGNQFTIQHCGYFHVILSPKINEDEIRRFIPNLVGSSCDDCRYNGCVHYRTTGYWLFLFISATGHFVLNL